MPQASHLEAHRPLLPLPHRLGREEVGDCGVAGQGGGLFRSIHLGNRQSLERVAVGCVFVVCWLDCRGGNGKWLFFQWINDDSVELFLLLLELRLELEDGLGFLRDLQREEGLEGAVPLVAHVAIFLGKHADHLLELLRHALHLLQNLLYAGVRAESVTPQRNSLVSHLTLSRLVLLSQGLPHLPGSSLWVIFMDLSEDALEEGLVFAELTGVQLPQRLLAGQAGVFASFPILGVEGEDAFFGQGPFFLLELETVELAAL